MRWHESEQPQAVYPAFCEECGSPSSSACCDRCFDLKMRNELITREAKLQHYWQEEARKREERIEKYWGGTR